MLKRYWTIQHIAAWQKAEQMGCLTGSLEHIAFGDWEESYQWMREQMKKRLAGFNGEWPIWLWLEKPDLRCAAHGTSGEKMVRLTIELEEQEVLASDFDKWHCVLNDGFCSDTEKEDDAWEKGKIDLTKEQSWERIFELDRPHNPSWQGPREGRTVQGTIGKVSLKSVKKVEHFTAR